MKTRTIGFLDYDLDNFHAEKFLELLRTNLTDQGWVAGGCWAMREAEGRVWAADRKVPFVDRAEQLQDCDALMVLAPSNPEKHLELAEIALPLGKPTYIDKPFAPDLATARRIFALADAHGAPVITTSALRCSRSLADEIQSLGRENILHACAWAGSGEFSEYAIHAVEIIVSALGPEVVRVQPRQHGSHTQILIEFSGNRTGTVLFHPHSETLYQAMLSTADRTRYVNCCDNPIFEHLARMILRFFETGEEVIDRRESLAIRQILDLATDGKEASSGFPWAEPADTRVSLAATR